MASLDELQWSWRNSGSATGRTVEITRGTDDDDDFEATVKLMIHDGTALSEEASEIVDVDPKDNCRERDMFGSCRDREPAGDDSEIVVPPLEDLPPSPAPPRRMPIMLPRLPFMQMIPGFA